MAIVAALCLSIALAWAWWTVMEALAVAKATPYSHTDKGEFILDNSGRASTKTSISDEIAHLRGLDIKGLRSRWQKRIFQRPPPDHLPRHLLFAIIAYRIQADRFGDLDHETRQVP
jgi:hypothetical protein